MVSAPTIPPLTSSLSHRHRAGGGLQYRAQPILKLVICLATSLVHLVAPAFAVPAQHLSDYLGIRSSSSSSSSSLQEGLPLAKGHGGGGHGTDDPVKLALDILTIAALVVLGGIFAGLTLGLMGLDMVNLQVMSTSGTEKERQHALKVIRLLEKGRHWVLVVLLLGNVIVNETLPVFLSDFGGGLAAVLSSTLLIVIFGEIVPQSICARYGLAIGAFCAPLVNVLMIVMAPVAWPTAKLLDWCLGEEHGTTYRKAELKTFVSLHQQIGTEHLNEDEVTIIKAVLDLNDKTVKDVMTPIEDVFTMSSDTIMDEEGVAKLVKSGYSRVPIYEAGKPDAILGMLLVKNLIQYDPEDSMPVSHFHLMSLPEASPELTLLDCLNYFQQGRSHMILVSDHPGEASGALGVVTLEDVIEEMIGEEIIDETDVFVDVHNKIKVVRTKTRDSTAQQNWQPLIRGIIERRRKFGGGATKVPYRSSYGTMVRSDTINSSSSPRYGAPPLANSRAVERVAIKRPGSPTSTSDFSAAAGGLLTPSSRRQSRADEESVSEYGGGGGGGGYKYHCDRDHRMSSASEEVVERVMNGENTGPYIVEVGSQDGRPRVILVEDIPERPSTLTREPSQMEEDPNAGERRPLLEADERVGG
ncbi:DUF21-domain-containing protein, partial [Violaceomyces palustris]